MDPTEQPVLLRLPAAPRDSSVRLLCDPAIPGGRSFALADGHWHLRLPTQPVDRFEYRLEVIRDHRRLEILDPANHRIVRTPDGHRSVWAHPGYRPPGWTRDPVLPGAYRPLSVPGPSVDERVDVTVWSPADLSRERPAGLLLVLDGPEYDLHASLVRLCSHLVRGGRAAPHRVALLTPSDRDDSYSGSHIFLRMLTGAVVDRLDAEYARAGPVAVLGASLGGLTAVLAGLLDDRFGGVVAQSGSFFHLSTDATERRFRHFGRIAAHVDAVADMPPSASPLTVALTCGAHEENAANNRRMAVALERSGHLVGYREGRDLHTFTGWRDALAPALADVLAALW